MNRTIKEGEADQETLRGRVSPLNVKRFHYDSHDQLRAHLADFMAAYNFARRLKTLGGLGRVSEVVEIGWRRNLRVN